MKHFDDYTESIDALGAKQQKIVADEIGKTYKFLTVISFAFRNRHELYFNCRCECGTEKTVKLVYLKSGHTVSCGCKRGKAEYSLEQDDLTGMTFGMWKVLGRDMSRKDKPYYFCRCQCGTERSVDKYSLKNGVSWHCGCQEDSVRSNAAKKYSDRFAAGLYDRKPVSLVGERFGRLTVIELLTEKRSGEDSLYRCRCECGNEIEASYIELKNAKGIRSCGCLRADIRNDLAGQRFGRLTAIEPIARPGKRLVWRCNCDCGKETYVLVGSLLHGSSKSCGCLSSDMGKVLIKSAIAKSGNVDETNLYQVRSGLEGKVSKRNTSGVRGVYIMQGRYYATISFKKKKYALGGYATLEQAAEVRKKAEQILFGEWLDYYEDELREDYEASSDVQKAAAIQELVEFYKCENNRENNDSEEKSEEKTE